MSWKPFVLQLTALAALLWLTAQHFYSLHEHRHSRLAAAQEQLRAEIGQLNRQIAALDRGSRLQSLAAPAAGETAAAAAELTQRIAALEQRVKMLVETAAALIKGQAALVKQVQPEAVRVRNWMSGLDAEKRASVQTAYQEQLERMEKAAAAPGPQPPSPELLESLLQESREDLKLKLRELLDDAEYQAFLDSLDDTRLPLGLPPLPAD